MCGECGLWPSWDRGIIYKCVSMWRGRPGDILRGLASHTRVIIVTRESWGPQTGPAAPINITISQSPLLIKLFPPSSWGMIMSQSNVILFLPSIVIVIYRLDQLPLTLGKYFKSWLFFSECELSRGLLGLILSIWTQIGIIYVSVTWL